MMSANFPLHPIGVIICRYIAGTLCEGERELLKQWLLQDEANRALFKELTSVKKMRSAVVAFKN